MVSKQTKQKLPKHEVDYVFVEKQDQDFASIKLISGPYTDIIYQVKFETHYFISHFLYYNDNTLQYNF